MSVKKHNDAFWWSLFGAGGTVAAFLLPVHIFITGIAIPFGWLPDPGYENLLSLAEHPLSRFYLFILVSLSFFHWAHRFRYTLYDGLMLKHLERYIKIFCYGAAIAGSAITAILLI